MAVFLPFFFLLLVEDELLKEGDEAFIAGSYTAAQNAYSKALEIESDNYRAFFKRATVHLQVGRHSDALYDLNQVLQINPSYHLALVTRGKLNKELGKFSQARQDLETVLESKKATVKQKAQQELDDVTQLENLIKQGNQLLAEKRYNEADDVFSKAISKAPSWGLPRLARARVQFDAGKYNAVLEDTLRLLKVTKNNVDAILLRGNAFRYLGDLEAAEKYYDNCLLWESYNNECAEAKSSLAVFKNHLASAERRIENGHGKLALQDIERCLTLEPNLTFFHPKLYLLKCKAYIKNGDADAAIQMCDKVLNEYDPNMTEAMKAKGEAHILKEEYDEAIRQYEKAVNAGDNSAHEGLQNARKLQKMASRKDYYKMLGIPKTASAQDIKKGYRKLAMQYHPDKMRTATQEERDEAEKKMKDLGEAYDVLSDPEKKGKYDRGDDLDNPNNNQWGGHGFGHNPFQGFNFNFRRG